RCRGINLSLMLGIAYGASIGGVATLVGTPPNLVFARVYSIAFPEEPAISFGQWILFGLPFSFVLLFGVWLLMTRVLCRVDKELQLDSETLREEREGLGRMSREEKVVAVIFAATALLWVFRTDITVGSMRIPGWTKLWEPFGAVHDGTIAIAMALLLFLIPGRGGLRGGAILDGSIFAKVPWGIVLLFGGGFALANGFGSSGLSEWVAHKFTGTEGVSPFWTIFLVSGGINLLTELTSNTATTQMFLPLLASMAVGLGIHPMLLMVSATISASMAFMMPVATPPNAIVFGSGYIRIVQMVRVGCWINVLALGLTVLYVWFLVPLIFDISQMPVSALESID
ncbi:MAG TPA: SLC13 family permease, partial [Opitutales bacterium]|nr:SLC13 family permease [Opitutales bacterium]